MSCCSLLFILCFCASLSSRCLCSQDSNPYSIQFSLGSVYRGNETIVSPNGTFEAGLFSPLGSDRVYFGIWYARLLPRTVVWVANRNVPVFGAAEYGCSAQGELEVRSEGGSKVAWSSGTRGRGVTGVLLEETGNLRLVGGGGAANASVWESFDYPGNTLLPYMKIGLGKKLTSWSSATDPAEGLYSLQMLPSLEFVCMWGDRRQYWSSGAWNGAGFAAIPEMINNTYFSFYLDKSGFFWTLAPSVTLISRFIIDTDGELKQYAWNPSVSGWTFFWSEPQEPCLIYALCGPNSLCRSSFHPPCSCPAGFHPSHAQNWASSTWSAGCSPESPAKCGGGVFFPLANSAFDSVHVQRAVAVASNADCSVSCLRNCSCAAYSYNEGVCELLFEPLLNGHSAPDIADTVYMRAGVSPAEGNRTRSRRLRTEVVVLIGSACVLLGGVGIAICVLRAKKRAAPRGTLGTEMIEWFTYAQLQYATTNFSSRLGSGGFGAVFKGFLGVPAIPVAVKQLQHRHRWEQGEKQFRMEVSTIGSIQHVNLVRLRGFCSEKSHRMLVYEFMPNGSLDTYLSKTPSLSSVKDPHSAQGPFLDWATRYQIALGTARGVAYLHDGCRQCIFHCDIKPENILLDADYTAKVSDFGLAKLVGKEFSRVITTIRGTRGYLAPEWIAGVPITCKADVYSYGMTLLELISGRRNLSYGNSTAVWTSSGADPRRRFFPVWAALCINEKKDLVASLADARLGGQVDAEQLRRAAYSAVWCIQEKEGARPTMRQVVHILEGSIDVTPPPVPLLPPSTNHPQPPSR